MRVGEKLENRKEKEREIIKINKEIWKIVECNGEKNDMEVRIGILRRDFEEGGEMGRKKRKMKIM